MPNREHEGLVTGQPITIAPSLPNVTVYVSIGNSDNKLTQEKWAMFCRAVMNTVFNHASTIHGEWYSLSNEPYQNATICFEVGGGRVPTLKNQLHEVRVRYGQDSIAWAIVEKTEFI
jgi:hypothetical protein